jgi:hypothetical protein
MTRPAGDRAYSLAACAVMFLWPVVTTDFTNVNAVSILVALSALILGALVFFRNVSPWLVTIAAVAAGVALRLTTDAYSGSDVATATAEALRAIAAGTSPYHHIYTTTNPQGQPFPYLPGELTLYDIQQRIFGSLQDHDRWWSIGAVLGIAALAPACGAGRVALATALLAVSSTNVLIGVDGSNDSGLLFLLVAAILALAYAARAARAGRVGLAAVLYALSAAFFGWALAFKALVWIAFPFVLRAIAPERRFIYALGALGIALTFCAPYAIAAPAEFFHSIGAGFTSHDNVWGFNVWAALDASYPAIMKALQKFTVPVAIFATLFTAMTLWTRKPATLGDALLQNCVVLAAMLMFARWTSLAYYAFLIGTLALAIATFGFELEAPQAAGAEKR